MIAAEGEQKASLALKEASDIICESPTALQLRYLQTLTQVRGDEKEKNYSVASFFLLDVGYGKPNLKRTCQ